MQFKASDIQLIENTYNTSNDISKPLPSDFIINLSKGNILITKSNVLLALLEIIDNYKAYNTRNRPTQKLFWYQSLHKSCLLSPILSPKFSVSSLKNISLLIQRQRHQFETMNTLIKANKEYIDKVHYNAHILFFGLIKLLKSKNSSKTLEQILLEMRYKLKSKPINVRIKGLSKKKKGYVPKQNTVRKLQMNTLEKEDKRLSNQLLLQPKFNPMMVDNNEKELYKGIEEIVGLFQCQFPNENTESIMNVLENNSMNIEDTYSKMRQRQTMSNGNKESIKISNDFNSSHDYIIQIMKDTDIYDELISNKGEKLVKEREQFLKSKYLYINNNTTP